MNIIGETIRKARRANDFTQTTLAKKIGVSREIVWAWEKGIYKPSGDTLLILMKILGLKLEDFKI